MEAVILPDDQEGLIDSYDRFFYSQDIHFDGRREAGFANLGFFSADIQTVVAACEHLMERLLGLVKQKAA